MHSPNRFPLCCFFAASHHQINISLLSSNTHGAPPRQDSSSPNSIFAAGYLFLPNSMTVYTFFIWYLNISNAVVWSANPGFLVFAAASLHISSSGELRRENSFVNGPNLWPS